MLLRNLFPAIFCFYMHIKCITSENSSLGFVIDDTFSMQDDIDFVKRGAKTILDLVESKKSNIDNIVLVTFNDPEVSLLTKSSKKTFLKDLDSIYAKGGGDCPEMALSGIAEGLKASGPESYIFVFTDANAGDYWKLRDIQSLCQKKQSQVIIVYSHDKYCYQPYGEQFTVYYEIAKSCSGQVIILEKNEVDMVLKIVASLLGGRHSIFKWTTIYSAPKYTPIEFKLDEKAEYAMVSVTSGKNVHLKITYENLVQTEVNYEKIMWNKNSKVVKLIKPKPGTYKAWVKGNTHITIVVYGRTDFTFNHGFSTLEPKSMLDTIPQPIAGIDQHVSINVTDPNNSVLIKTLRILDTNNAVFATLPLKNIGNNLYVTNVVRSPGSTFKIGITGIIKATGNEITRYSNNIIPRIQDPIPQSAPKVEIAEGTKLDVNYGSDVTLTCRVTAHPKPTIEWYSSSGHLLSSEPSDRIQRWIAYWNNGNRHLKASIQCQCIPVPVYIIPSSEIDDPKFVSYLNLKNFKKEDTFSCRASNRLNSRGRVSAIKIGVKPIFTVVGAVEHKVNYKQDATVPCNIESYLPIKIKWFRSGKQLNGNSKEYSVSPDGSRLTLRSMNLEMQGKYVCEATLTSDPTINKSHDRVVKIDGLVFPVITSATGAVKNNTLTAICRYKAFPKATISWQFQSTGSKVFKPIAGSAEELNIPKAKIQHIGVYKCIVKNILGTTDQEIVVTDPIPQSAPKVAIAEGTELEVNYGTDVTLTCRVTAHPKPTIEWYSSSGNLLSSESSDRIQRWIAYWNNGNRHLKASIQCQCIPVPVYIIPSSEIDDPKFVSYLNLKNFKKEDTFSCRASNRLNSRGRVSAIKIGVKPIFTVVGGVEHKVNYKQDATVPCNIESYLPIKIKWFRSGKQLNGNSKEYSVSPDGSRLTLRSMNLEMQGKYVCEATLTSDPTINKSHDRVIKIDGLVFPVITSATGAVKNNTLTAICRYKAFPKATISWQFQSTGSKVFKPIAGSEEKLNIPKAKIQHIGVYKCIVKNILGTTDQEIVVTDPIPQSAPKVEIAEGTKLDVNYGTDVTLTCRVTAHPKPTIEWYSSSGNLLSSQSSEIDDPKFVSYLSLKNFKKDETFTCRASNILDSGRVSAIKIDVKPIFTVVGGVEHKVNYKQDAIVPCNIKSYLPIKIKWFRSGKLLNGNSKEYSISPDGSQLTLRSMNLEMQGKYVCEATLGSDPTINKSNDRIVKIDGLAYPVITSATAAVKNHILTAICRIKAFPKATISWQFQPMGSKVFKPIAGSAEELIISKVNMRHTGVYKCIGKNVLGTTEHDQKVEVEEAPVIHNTKYTYYGVEGDLVLKIPCNVTGFPSPTVDWSVQNNPNKKPAVKGSTLHLDKPVKLDSAVYVCHATNTLGHVNKQFNVIIVGSFEDDDKFRGGIHKVYVEEGKSKTLKCNVPNVETGSVRWYEDGLLSEHKGTTYTIENASLDDQKNYTCRVNTDEGSISETYVLIIGDIPMFDNDRSTTIDWKHNPMELDCKAYGNPDPQFKWEHKGNVLKTENNAQEIDVMDWGEYKCLVSNEIGNISRTFKVITSGCFITKYVGSQNQPLISTTGAPTQPPAITNSGLFIETNTGLKFSCPNPKQTSNEFKVLPGKREIVAKCIAEDKFNVDGKTYRYADLQCNTKVVPSVSRTGETCFSPNSEIIRVGFEVNGFLEAYKICYDTKFNVPLYGIAANEIVIPDDFRFTDDLADFTWSSVPELGKAKTGNWKSERNCTCCYKQGQLINVNTLAFGPIQDASFKDNLNAIPIWNTLCDKSRVSWEQVEKSVMFLSAFGFNEWHSWTGASEYLFKDGGLVPRYLWKVVKRNDKFSVVVFVNDRSPVDTDIRCSETCDIIKENRDKFLYCCTLDEFSKRFGVPLNTFKAV